MKVEKYIDVNDSSDNSIVMIYTEYFKSKYFEEKHHKKWDYFNAFCSQINAVLEHVVSP